MPLTAALRSAFGQKRFWTDYFSDAPPGYDPGRPADGAPGPRNRGHRVEFPASDGRGLALDFDATLSNYSLKLRRPPEAEPVELAWDNQLYWHPDILRWDELDLLARATALRDPDLPHPGLPLLLLSRFAPICVGDDVDAIFPMAEAAWRGLGLFSGREVDRFLEWLDRRQGRFAWRRIGADRWVMEQPEEAQQTSGFHLKSLRVEDYPEFPHATWEATIAGARRAYESAVRPDWLAWDGGTVARLARRAAESGDMAGMAALGSALEEAGCSHPTILDACRRPNGPARACWVVELLSGTRPGEVVRRHFGPTSRATRTRHTLTILLPVSRERFAFDPEAGPATASSLDLALAEAGLGGATVYHRTRATGPQRTVEEFVSIEVTFRGDPEDSIRIIREALESRGAPDSTALTLCTPERRPIPLRPLPGG